MKKQIITLNNIDKLIAEAAEIVNTGSVTVESKKGAKYSLPYRNFTRSGGCTVKKSESMTAEEKQIFNTWFNIAQIVDSASRKGRTAGDLASVRATHNDKKGLCGVTARTTGVTVCKSTLCIVEMNKCQKALDRLAKLEAVKKELEAAKLAVENVTPMPMTNDQLAAAGL